MRRPRHLRVGMVVLAGLALAWALRPQPAYAACGDLDLGCGADVLVHQMLVLVATAIWVFNRTGLVAARTLEGWREDLLTTVLAPVYETVVRQGLAPFFFIALLLVWTIFQISQALIAVLELNWVDLRRVLRTGALALWLFSLGGQALVVAVNLQQTIIQAFQELTTTATTGVHLNFYTAADGQERAYYRPMYDGAAGGSTSTGDCATVRARRTVPGRIYLNDIAMGYLFVGGWGYVHCPAMDFQLPPEFMRGNDRGFLGYVPSSNLGDAYGGGDQEAKRDELIGRAFAGLARQASGILLVGAAVLEQFLYLGMVLAVAIVGFGLAVALTFGLFLPTEGMLSAQIQALWGVLSASIKYGVVMGLVHAILGAAMATESSAAVNIAGLGALAALVMLVWRIWELLRSTGQQASAVLGSAPAAVHTAAVRAGGVLRNMRTAAVDAALVGGAITSGQGGAVLAGAAQRMAQNWGTSALGRVAGRALGPRVANRIVEAISGRSIDQLQQDSQTATREAVEARANGRAQRAAERELAWYQRSGRLNADGSSDDPTVAARVETLQSQLATFDGRAWTRREGRAERRILAQRHRGQFGAAVAAQTRLNARREGLATPDEAGAGAAGVVGAAGGGRPGGAFRVVPSGKAHTAIREVMMGAKRVTSLKAGMHYALSTGRAQQALELALELEQAQAEQAQARRRYVQLHRASGQRPTPQQLAAGVDPINRVMDVLKMPGQPGETLGEQRERSEQVHELARMRQELLRAGGQPVPEEQQVFYDGDAVAFVEHRAQEIATGPVPLGQRPPPGPIRSDRPADPFTWVPDVRPPTPSGPAIPPASPALPPPAPRPPRRWGTQRPARPPTQPGAAPARSGPAAPPAARPNARPPQRTPPAGPVQRKKKGTK